MVFREIKGIIGVLGTPIGKDGHVNEEGFRKNIDIFIESGCEALISTGSLGEWYKLSFEEHKRVIEIFVNQVNGRVPTISGTSRLDWGGSLKMTEYAAKAGCDAIMGIVPFYTPADKDEIFKFFSEIASVSRSLQVMIYNTISVSKVDIDAEMITKFLGIENITGIKEMSKDVATVYPKIVAGGDKIKLYQIEENFLPFWAIGARNGALCGFNPLDPTLMGDLYKALLAGNMDKARKCNDRLNILLSSELYKSDILEFNRIAYELKDIPITTGHRRKPYKKYGPNERKQIEQVLKNAKIL